MKTPFDFSVHDSAGKPHALAQHQGKVTLFVNVASKCGFTKQYDGLEALYKKYADRGLVILGFPCNQFGGQEPGTDAEIQEFCRMSFGVTFPVLGKVEVNGDGADPLYKFLTEAAPGILNTKAVKWNFTKFLVSKDGAKVERFAPNTEPKDLESAIEALL